MSISMREKVSEYEDKRKKCDVRLEKNAVWECVSMKVGKKVCKYDVIRKERDVRSEYKCVCV